MTEKQLIKRNKLKKISELAIKRNEKHNGEFDTVNDMIINYIYNMNKKLTFETYKNWKKKGYQVKKGEKAFLLWSKPLKTKEKDKKKKKEKDKEKKEPDFFGVAYIFSSAQVELVE